MTALPLSALEAAILRLVASRSWPGYSLRGLSVRRREYTGVGAYIYLDDELAQDVPDGLYAAGDAYIEMDGLKDGLFFSVDVTGRRPRFIELSTCGGEAWDGVERPWSLA